MKKAKVKPAPKKKFVSSYDSTRAKMKGKTQQYRIDSLIAKLKSWGMQTIDPPANMVRVFSEMYNLKPDRVKALIKKANK